MKRWIACDGYDDGHIRFFFTARDLTAQEIEYPGVRRHFTEAAIASVERGEKTSLSLREHDISRRQIASEIAAKTLQAP